MQAARVVSGVNILKKVTSRSKVSHFKRCISTTHSLKDSFQVQDADDFNQRVKNSKKPVVVDFFATWCNPCKALAPRLESVIAETNGKVDLAKVDIDEHSDLALDYDVGSVPVLLVIRNGKVEERLVGLQDTDKLRKFIDKAVAAN
ncbi:thioredoxin, mitochondrial [Nilaparvata lugens]|uniref:thioredoxin, mitochondrial n=1 Tax=Nilaparvata lugens TaxID=108931 RepID=UPI00193E241D|nr:thioredoxin, mitochondrial [Nilaparvata lugens]